MSDQVHWSEDDVNLAPPFIFQHLDSYTRILFMGFNTFTLAFFQE